MAKRPHIIILNPDEMRWDTMGHMGNRAAHTPNLDYLAVHEAVSFDHAFCQNPVCVPSRCSFLTGLYPHTTGHRTMHYLMHEGEPSLFSELKDAGYYVWLNGRNDFLSGDVNGLEELHADEVYYYDKNSAPDPSVLAKMASAGHQDRNADRPKEYSHFTGIDAAENTAFGLDMRDTYAAIDRIRRVDELGDQPLCLFLGWTNPHCPYTATKEFYDLIRDEDIVMPIDPASAVGKSRMVEKLREYANLDGWSDEQWRELRHIYLAMCAEVDHMVGMVIDALKEAGIYDDCAIFFLSDHGDFAGDFHLPEKAQSSFEDILTRVPLLIKPPKLKDEEGRDIYSVDPGLASGMVELVDFYATAMAYAGVTPEHDHFGKDLTPVIADRSASVREYAHSEGGRNSYEWQCDEAHGSSPEAVDMKPGDDYYAKKKAQMDDLAHEKAAMINDGKWKLIYRSSGASELYHLENDPYEINNLLCGQADKSKESEQEIAENYARLQTEALNWYQTTCDIVPYHNDCRFTEERMWGTIRNLVPADLEEEIRQYIRAEHPDYGPAVMHAVQMAMTHRS